MYNLNHGKRYNKHYIKSIFIFQNNEKQCCFICPKEMYNTGDGDFIVEQQKLVTISFEI